MVVTHLPAMSTFERDAGLIAIARSDVACGSGAGIDGKEVDWSLGYDGGRSESITLS